MSLATRSAGLELSRAEQHLEKNISRHAYLDVYRKFFTEEVAPWIRWLRGHREE